MASGPQKQPVPIIVDSDCESDVDDIGAFAVLHALADNGECDILATILCTLHPWSVCAVDVVNTYYGRGHLPVASIKGPGVNVDSRYTRHLRDHFPHSTACADDAPDALDAYRRLLAAQPDHGTVIVTLGYCTNLRNLLRTPPDAISPLDGRALVAAKVRKWVNMGGNFEHRAWMNTTNNNWTHDAASAVEAIRAWPAPIVFCGREIGHSMRAGAALAQTPANNPVRTAYACFFKGEPGDHHLADLSTILYAVRGTTHGPATYWLEEDGRIDLRDDAGFTWTPGDFPGPKRTRLVDAITKPNAGLMPVGEIQSVISDLLVQPPRARQKTS